MRSPLSYAPCKDTCPPSRYDNNPRPVAPSALFAEPSGVLPPRRRPSVALGSLWPKSLTLPTSRGHTDLVRKMPIRSQLRLLFAVDGHFVSSLSAPVYILRGI